MDPDKYKNYDECIQKMLNLFDYSIKVLRGHIVQVFYFAKNENIISTKDIFLKNLATSCSGILAGHDGLYNQRRDIDFYFENLDKAENFASLLRLSAGGYDIHNTLCIMGRTNPEYGTLDEILEKQRILINSVCGQIECNIKPDNNGNYCGIK